jgi:hypothetical protein
MKDPAFLFYSKDFYEGTRTMLPEERACYIDLMIYQHQNGPIPNDIRRMKQYCSGIDEATLKATLEAKFKATHEGWINERLQIVIDERNIYSSKQSQNGKIGQFYKKAKEVLTAKNYLEIRKLYEYKTNDELLKEIEKFDLSNKASLKASLEGLLKHLAIGNAIVIKDILLELNIENRYAEIVNLWIDYKKGKRQSYKTKESTVQMIKHLIEISDNNFDNAKKIIETSIANNWDGLFPLKQHTNGKRYNEILPGDPRYVSNFDKITEIKL